MLPPVKKCKDEKLNFPVKWQSVIFRNYGFVSSDKLADVLRCDEETVRREAQRLGLIGEFFPCDWEKKGYISIIRNNWFLLPYSQLVNLLGITEERLEFILENDDFLSVKLGKFKPECKEVLYAPLSETEREKTEIVRKRIVRLRNGAGVRPFDFFRGYPVKETATERANGIGAEQTRIVHGYLTPCGDAFLANSESYLPDVLLNEYRRQGINGLWFHGLLSALSFYPFDERLSKDFEKRRAELKRLIGRCKKYGIKVYLYLNEPRGIPLNRIGKYAYLGGRKTDDSVCLCLERKEVREYLYNATKDLLSDVKELGGIITITMSENPTHCNYRPHTNCPVCKNIPPEQSAADVNNILARAVKDSGTSCELIANLWGWSDFMGWSEEQTLRGVELLNREVSVMCVSEYGLPIEKGGVKSKIIDYSIGNPGPSDLTEKIFEKAHALGHKAYAKIQINNSWECSAVPFLPVFDLEYEHLKKLETVGVRDYMLTWTLGGYPSPAMGLATDFVNQGKSFSLDTWYQSHYGEYAKRVHDAVRLFSRGLREFPFSIDSLYYSPKTLGAANLWELEPSEKQSTMVCFSYDDYENWTRPYPYHIYVSQYEKLLRFWEEGVKIIDDIDDERVKETSLYAKAAYFHFKSDLLQTEFSHDKRKVCVRKDEIGRILQEEKEITVRLLRLLNLSPAIGFEASNHYFYTDRNLMEKVLNIERLERELTDFPG